MVRTGHGGEALGNFARIFELAQRGLLKTKVERAYSLGEFAEPWRAPDKVKRDGKDRLPNVDALPSG